MSVHADQHRLQRLRMFLCALSALLFAGTIAELRSVKQCDNRAQLNPFAVCGIGLVLLLLLWLRLALRVLKLVRLSMGLMAVSSLIGVYEHIEGNPGFSCEIHPHAERKTLFKAALTGRDPLMSPGILAVAASLAIAAIYAAPSRRLQAVDRIPSLAERPEPIREAAPSSTG